MFEEPAAEWDDIFEAGFACSPQVMTKFDRTQIPVDSAPLPSVDDSIALVSTSFPPAHTIHSSFPDIALLSCDSVFFWVNSSVLLSASQNQFNGLIVESPANADLSSLILPETSDILNIILHIIYGIDLYDYSPSFDDVDAATCRLPVYGISLSVYASPGRHLHNLLLSFAPLFPLPLYALAAQHELEELAVSASSACIISDLSSLTDELSSRMGPIYLRRLFAFHHNRMKSLRKLVLRPLDLHPITTPTCNFEEQTKLTRAWAFAAAEILRVGSPGVSASTLQAVALPVTEELACKTCQDVLKKRLNDVAVEWSLMERSI